MTFDPPTRQTAHTVNVPACGRALAGDLTVPPGASGVILFAHGSGSSRHSARNHYVARVLEQRGFATLLIDLLTPEEEIEDRATAHLRFDIPMLAERLVALVDWLHQHPWTKDLPIGLFGASTGGGAAMVAAAERPQAVMTVVSRGGRPDLAGAALERLTVPTLLIVGESDTPVIRLNKDAMAHMHHHATIEIVPGATHLFEEPGTLERVAVLASDWFQKHLRTVTTSSC